MTWRSVGKVCLALGVSAFLAIGTYQACKLRRNVDCDQGGCGLNAALRGLGYSGSGSACYQCVCTPNRFIPEVQLHVLIVSMQCGLFATL